MSLSNGNVSLTHYYDTVFFGVFVSTTLFGINVVQTWTYINENKDKWPLRLLVALVFLLDAGTAAVNAVVLQVTNFETGSGLLSLSKYGPYGSTVAVAIIFWVQLFFAYRLYTYNSTNRWLSLFIVVTAMAALGAGVAMAIDMISHQSVITVTSNRTRIEVGISGIAAICDMATSFGFWRSLPSTDSRSPVTLAQRVLQWIAPCGLLLTLLQIADFVLYVLQADKLNWAPIHFCLSHVYVITMMSILNQNIAVETITDVKPKITASAASGMIFQSHSSESNTVPVELDTFKPRGIDDIDIEGSMPFTRQVLKEFDERQR